MGKVVEPPVGPDFRNPDPGAQRLVEFLKFGERTILYWHLARRLKTASFAYIYVAVSIMLLFVGLATSGWWAEWERPYRALVAVVPAYRLWDIARWWLALLIDRRHWKVVSRERNIIFLGLNLTELSLIGAIFFCAAGLPWSPSEAWFHAFFLVTQLALPDELAGNWDRAAAAIVELTSLVLLLGGLAALLDLVSSKIREGPWSGPHDDFR